MLTSPPDIATIIAALDTYRGDDLYRAKMAFRNCTPAEMEEDYGHGGTRAQILATYEAHDAKVAAARAWVLANLK